MGRNPKEKSVYFIYCEGQKVEVTEEVYRAYYSGKYAEEYQQRRDKKNGLLYFSEMETDQRIQVDELLADSSISIERKVSSDLLMETLKTAFTPKEYEVIDGLYIQGLSMRELARNLKINISALEKRRDRLIPKLKKFIEKSCK